jgi:hypothetical protein
VTLNPVFSRRTLDENLVLLYTNPSAAYCGEQPTG